MVINEEIHLSKGSNKRLSLMSMIDFLGDVIYLHQKKEPVEPVVWWGIHKWKDPKQTKINKCHVIFCWCSQKKKKVFTMTYENVRDPACGSLTILTSHAIPQSGFPLVYTTPHIIPPQYAPARFLFFASFSFRSLFKYHFLRETSPDCLD